VEEATAAFCWKATIFIVPKRSKLSDWPQIASRSDRVLPRLNRLLRESAAVIVFDNPDPASDLAGRFSDVLGGLARRNVGADVLFETLKLEVLDWGLDNDIDTRILEGAPEPVKETEG